MKKEEIALDTLPGYAVRRLHQIAVALFQQETSEVGLTPVQYAALQVVCNAPGMDQGTLCGTMAFDTSTIGGVIVRLEARGLVERRVAAHDRRVRLVHPTPEGRTLLSKVVEPMLRSQELLLKPLPKHDRTELMRLINQVIQAHSEVPDPREEKSRKAR
jgi:DNA-binding MarR family transcriptional regulator